MKRVITLLLAAGLVLGAATASQATDIKAKGSYQFGFEGTNYGFTEDNDTDRFQAHQRFRTQIDFIASENLKGVVFFEIGRTDWGDKADGGALGTDGINVKTRYAYIDWVIPNTDVQVRMGLQPYALPGFVADSPILGNPVDGAGITLSAQFTENVGASLFWMRAENTDYIDYDALDLIGLTVPVTFDGVKVTPWAMGAFIGKNSLNDVDKKAYSDPTGDRLRVASGLLPAWTIGDTIGSDDDSGNAWWVGFTGELTMFDPFRFAWDAAYGSVDMGSAGGYDFERAGWYVAAIAQYKMDFVTPGLMAFYASGDDDNIYDGSEQIPNIDAGWNASSFGFDGGVYSAAAVTKISDTIAGLWGVQLRFDDISFMEDLKHDLRFAYYTGTNDEGVIKALGAIDPTNVAAPGKAGSQGLYLTKKDHAFEVNFDTDYNIYENLILTVELGYINLDLDGSVWEKSNLDEDAYKVAAYLTYNF